MQKAQTILENMKAGNVSIPVVLDNAKPVALSLQRFLKARWLNLGIAAFGAVLVLASLLLYGNSPMFQLLFANGAIIVMLAFLLYFLSPDRYMRCEISDAMVLSSVELANTVLSSIPAGKQWFYIPSSTTGDTKVYVKIAADKVNDTVRAIGGMPFHKGLFITPPGSSLYMYCAEIGAKLTPDGIESEMKDVIVNGLELASDVKVERSGDLIKVTLTDIVNSKMCSAIRSKSPEICGHIGCPMCSLISCMVAEGTGKVISINDLTVDNKNIHLTYRLF